MDLGAGVPIPFWAIAFREAKTRIGQGAISLASLVPLRKTREHNFPGATSSPPAGARKITLAIALPIASFLPVKKKESRCRQTFSGPRNAASRLEIPPQRKGSRSFLYGGLLFMKNHSAARNPAQRAQSGPRNGKKKAGEPIVFFVAAQKSKKRHNALPLGFLHGAAERSSVGLGEDYSPV